MQILLSEKSHRLSVIELREWERLPTGQLPYFKLPDELIKKPAPFRKKRKATDDDTTTSPPDTKKRKTGKTTPTSLSSHLSPSDAHILASAKKKMKARGIITLFPDDGVSGSKKREGGRQKELKKLLHQGEMEYRIKLSGIEAATSL